MCDLIGQLLPRLPGLEVPRGLGRVLRRHGSQGQIPGHEAREVVHSVLRLPGRAVPLAEIGQPVRLVG